MTDEFPLKKFVHEETKNLTTESHRYFYIRKKYVEKVKKYLNHKPPKFIWIQD
jgi:hypothetical protein